MSRAHRHLDKVIRDQKVAPVPIDQPHFLFDWPCDAPELGEHQICATPYDGHLAELKLVEWGCKPAAVNTSSGELQLVPR